MEYCFCICMFVYFNKNLTNYFEVFFEEDIIMPYHKTGKKL